MASPTELAHEARASRLGDIGKYIDYAAIAYRVLLAGSDHAPKFRPQRLQARDLALDFAEMASRQSVDARAGPDGIIGETCAGWKVEAGKVWTPRMQAAAGC